MRHQFRITGLRGPALTAAALGGVTLAFSVSREIANPTVVALSYLLVVLIVAASSALWVAVAASVAAVALLNFFFLPPVGTFTIADPDNWVALGVLLVVSLIASNLSSSVRARAQEATARRDELARLFDLSRDILVMSESEDAYQQLARSIARRFDLRYVAICLPAASRWQIHEAGEGTFKLAAEQLETLPHTVPRALDSTGGGGGSSSSGRQTIYSKEAPPLELVPLRVAGRTTGLLAVAGRPIEDGTLDTLAGVAAIAVERVQLLEEREAAEVERRSAELKSALLASLAHDLRTPLTAIRVAANNLQAAWATDQERHAQSEIVLAEVERLNRLFQNILDMARIDTNAVTAAREWVTPEEIVEAAMMQVERTTTGHRLAATADSHRLAQIDPRLTSAALAHLLENAARYSPRGSTISVRASAVPPSVTIVVEDEGPGIAEADMPRLFDRFFRGEAAAGQPAGLGMGLAITRGLLAAEDGSVWAENRPEGGARFTIRVPAAVRAAAPESRGVSGES